MSVTVQAISGPNDVEFLYYRATHDADGRFVKVRTVMRSAIASGALSKDDEKAALVAEVEQMYSDYLATAE
jgi:hypothetical protein